MTEKVKPIKSDVISHILDELPRVKIVSGDSVIVCKNDSLFGNYIAYEIARDSEVQPIKNLIKQLNSIFNAD